MSLSDISRYLLISFNLCFWSIGTFLITVGFFSKTSSIFATSDWHEIEQKLGNINLMARISQISWSLIFIGMLTFILGGVGCCGAYKKSRSLLMFYVLMLLILISVKLAAIYMLVTYESTVILQVQRLYDTALTKVVNSNLTDQISLQAVDATQMLLKCCGSNSSDSYTNNILPLSCYPDLNATLPYKIGCDNQIANYINTDVPLILYSLSTVVIIEVLAIIFSVCVYHKIDESQ